VTAIVPEPATALEAIVGAPRLAVPGLNAWLGKSDFQQSLDDGFTESYEDFCTRISNTDTTTGGTA
jgi:hypothetical protein